MITKPCGQSWDRRLDMGFHNCMCTIWLPHWSPYLKASEVYDNIFYFPFFRKNWIQRSNNLPLLLSPKRVPSCWSADWVYASTAANQLMTSLTLVYMYNTASYTQVCVCVRFHGQMYHSLCKYPECVSVYQGLQLTSTSSSAWSATHASRKARELLPAG